MNLDIDEPIPEVWDMFLRLISDDDKEYKFLYKIIVNQLMRIISNMREIYQQDHFKNKSKKLTDNPLEPIQEAEEVGTKSLQADPAKSRH